MKPGDIAVTEFSIIGFSSLEKAIDSGDIGYAADCEIKRDQVVVYIGTAPADGEQEPFHMVLWRRGVIYTTKHEVQIALGESPDYRIKPLKK